MKLGFIGDIFFPPTCVACHKSLLAGVLCEPCRKSIDIADTLFCGTCAARLPELKKICHVNSPYVLGAAAAYDNDTVKALIHALKFQGIEGAATPLAEILVEYVSGLGIDLTHFWVTPLPLSQKRQRARGFNQSARIAHIFARTLQLPLAENFLKRIHHRKPQSDTEDIFERKENIRGCFFLDHDDAVSGKNIVLIDDVTTSGTTFGEATKVLKAGGAKKIIALAVARA